jgi:hypothetical protein
MKIHKKWKAVELSGCWVATNGRTQIVFECAGYAGDKRRCKQYIRIRNERLNRM